MILNELRSLVGKLKNYFFSIVKLLVINNKLKIEKTALCYESRGVEIDISYSDILNKFSFSEGILYNTYSFLYKGEDLTIRLLKNEDILFQEKIISTLEDELHDRFIKKENLWNIEGYLKRSAVVEFVENIHPTVLSEVNKYFYKNFSDKTKEELLNLTSFINNFISELVLRNEKFVKDEIVNYENLFNTVEKNPLTVAQRRACVINEQNNLVLAGAGSGKTSVMVARCAYLLEACRVDPDEILILAFNNKAAKEINERIEKYLPGKNIQASTFHKLGMNIIKQVTAKSPTISKLTDDKSLDDFITRTLEDKLNNDRELRNIVFDSLKPERFELKSEFLFKTKEDYANYLKENELRTLKGELVKSYGELLVANYLFQSGINYTYEKNYQVNTSNEIYSQYRPDFFLDDFNVYIEYIGIDKDGNVAPYIDKDTYLNSLTWKRGTHLENKTDLIEIFYSDLQADALLIKLEEKLKEYNIQASASCLANQYQVLNEFLTNFEITEKIRKIVSLLKTINISNEEANARLSESKASRSDKMCLYLAKVIGQEYHKELSASDEIDFNDMINISLNILKRKQFKSRWTHILVDEFQDISKSRAELIKEIRDLNNGTIFCVGDDWQAIYHFAGSSSIITRKFEDFFGPSQIVALDKTFRFNNKISDVASKFVMSNPSQLKKDISTIKKADEAKIFIALIKNKLFLQDELLSFLSRVYKPTISQTILVLHKNNMPLQMFKDNYFEEINKKFPKLELTCLTFHKSKGLEADFVIILGLNGGEDGFPSEKGSESISNKLHPQENDFPYSEERRLFYVALTRAKEEVLLVVNAKSPSIFINELLLNDYEVSLKGAEKKCPQCDSGFLIKKLNKQTQLFFLGCTNYQSSEKCRYTVHL